MSAPTPLDVLRQFADSDGLPYETVAAVAELVEAAGLALADHEQEGIELNHDTVTALRAALAKFGGAK